MWVLIDTTFEMVTFFQVTFYSKLFCELRTRKYVKFAINLV